jgi:hypothetical protein
MAGCAEWVRRGVGRSHNGSVLVALSAVLVAWVAAFGLLLNLFFLFTLPLVVVAVIFLLRLHRAYPSEAPVQIDVAATNSG